MYNCRRCGTELNTTNWYGAIRRMNSHICNSCEVKRVTEYNDSHRGEYLQRLKDWRTKNHSHHIDSMRQRTASVKAGVIEHYSSGTNACADPYNIHLPQCPFLTMMEVLTIDHINGGGSKQRRELRGHSNIYYWLTKNNFPDGFQVLCIGCQFVKKHRFETNRRFVP